MTKAYDEEEQNGVNTERVPMTPQESYDLSYDGTTRQRSHLRGQVGQLADRMPSSYAWESALRDQSRAQNDALRTQLENEQRSVYDDANGMMQAVNRGIAQKTLRMQYSNATLMKMANGGVCQPQMIAWWNARNRSGDADAALVSAGYNRENGNFDMMFRDANGAQKTVSATQLDQYNMANNMPGIFSYDECRGMRDALMENGHSEQELAKYSNQLSVIGGTSVPADRAYPTSVNLTTGEVSGVGQGGRPGPRPRFWSEDDFNGTPFMQPNGEGTRYRGNGISTFSTASFREDRENARNPNGRWVEMSVGPSDTFDGKNDRTQMRTYRNDKTGEVVRVKDGETPPWRKDPVSDSLKRAELAERGRMKRAQEAENNKNERAAFFGNLKEKQFMMKYYGDMKKNAQEMLSKAVSEDEKKAANAEIARIDKAIANLNGLRASDEPEETEKPTGVSGLTDQIVKKDEETKTGKKNTGKVVKNQESTAKNETADDGSQFVWPEPTGDESKFVYLGKGRGEEYLKESEYAKLSKVDSKNWRKVNGKDGYNYVRVVYGKHGDELNSDETKRYYASSVESSKKEEVKPKEAKKNPADMDYKTLKVLVDKIGINFDNVATKFETLSPEEQEIWGAFLKKHQDEMNGRVSRKINTVFAYINDARKNSVPSDMRY